MAYAGGAKRYVLNRSTVLGILHAALANGRRDLKWTMISFLKCLDYADKICLLFSRVMALGQMALHMEIKTNKLKDLMIHRDLPHQ